MPDDLVADRLLELEQYFGAISAETQIIRELWRNEGGSCRDDLVRVFEVAPVNSSLEPVPFRHRPAGRTIASLS